MTAYNEHHILCIVQSDELSKTWAEFSQLVMDNPEFQINREAFDNILNLILSTRVHTVTAMDEAVEQIQKAATTPLSEATVHWFIDVIDDLAVAIMKAIPCLTPANPGLVAKCALINHSRRNFTLNVTILEPLPETKENWTVTHF